MTEPMVIVLGILAGAVGLWSWGRPRADIVAVLIVLGLMVSGVLTPQESLAGFGDPVVILIAAVFVVGAALENTGIVHRLSLGLLKLGGGSEMRLLVLIMLLVGVLTAFMSSTAVTAMFIPVVLAISGKTGLNRKRLLMPLAVAATIGGMMTLISSLPNMIVVNVLAAKGLPPLNFFSVTPFGVAVLVAGIAYMVLARGLLSREKTVTAGKARAPRAHDLLGFYGLTSRWHRLQVPAGSPLIGCAVAHLRSLYDRFGVIPVGFEKHSKGKTAFLPALPDTTFDTDDAVFVIVGEEQAQPFIEAQQLRALPQLDERQAHEALQELGVAEIMLAPESGLIARTVGEISFRTRYRVSVLAVRHRGERLTTNLAEHTLDFGDTLLVAGGWDDISRLRNDGGDFVVLTLSAEYQERLTARRRAPVAIAILALMVVFGAAALIGLFLSNAATTLLIAPVAIEAAQTLHVSPEAFAMTVVISCSASFVTPVSSTWNLLVMEPGGYSFGDYVKVGLPLLFLTMVITVTLVRVIYRF